MSKQEYLESFSRYLRELNPEERQKQLDYYGEMLADMLEDGLSMEEVTLRLGTPKALAEEVLAAMGRPLPAEEEPKAAPALAAAPRKRKPIWPWIVLGVVVVALLLWLVAGLLFGAPKGGLLGMIQREVQEEVWDDRIPGEGWLNAIEREIRDELDLDEQTYRASAPASGAVSTEMQPPGAAVIGPAS